MRKLIRTLLTAFLLVPFCADAQVDSLLAPYQKHPTLPPIDLLMADSSTHFRKANIPPKTKVMLMLFSPDCSHCQHTAQELHKYKKEMKDIQVVMATMHPLSDMRNFITTYHLDSLENVKVGKDIYFFMIPFYSIHNLPFMAFYNKKGKLISVFEGSMPLQKVIALFKENH
jgi:thioredoxin-related protein